MKITAEEFRKSRTRHLLKSYGDAVKQLAAFRAVTPVTEQMQPFSPRMKTIYRSNEGREK